MHKPLRDKVSKFILTESATSYVLCYEIMSINSVGYHLPFQHNELFYLPYMAIAEISLVSGAFIRYLYLLPGIWYVSPGIRYLLSSIWYFLSDICIFYQVSGTFHLVSGTFYLVSGTFYLISVSSTRYLAPFTWYQVKGTRKKEQFRIKPTFYVKS